MWIRPIGLEDPLEEEMATHPQYSCLEKPLRGAWWTHRVTKSQTRLKDLARVASR